MPITPDRIAKLREFGLSEYAARVYLALLDLGETDARAISTLSKVPTSKIYQTLEQLHDRGLVTIIPETPKRYAPVPFEDYLDRVHHSHLEAAKSIEANRDELSRIFSVIGTVEMEGTGGFTVFRGRRNAIEKVQELLARTESDWLAFEPPGFAERCHGLLPEFQKARARGVTLRFLTPLTKESVTLLEGLSEVAEIRDRPVDPGAAGSNVAILVSDACRALVITFNPDDASLYVGKDVGISSDQEGIVRAMEGLLSTQWAEAPAYENRRAEILHGRAPEFTRFHTNQTEAYRTITTAVREGCREFLYVNALPVGAPVAAGKELLEVIREHGTSARIILNVADSAAAEAYMKVMRAYPKLDVRHLDAVTFTRFWVFDEREACFSTAAPEGFSAWQEELHPDSVRDLVVHTNNLTTVASLRTQFKALWERAVPLETRRNELTLFPHMHPRELGLGRLFDRVSEGVLVLEADGTINLTNPAMATLTGRETTALLSRKLMDHLDGPSRDLFERVLRRTCAEALEGAPATAAGTLEVQLRRADATLREVEISLSLLKEPSPTGGPLVLALLRDVTERNRAEEQARRLSVEQASRAEAAAAARRAAFLAEVSGAVTASLDPEETLRSVARLGVPALGEICALFLRDENGDVRQVAVNGTDAGRVQATRDIWTSHRWSVEQPYSILGVIERSNPYLLTDINDEWYQKHAGSPEELDLLRRQGATALLMVPLMASGRVVGALGVFRTTTTATFGPQEIALVGEVAHRIGLSLENARLLAAANEARALAERTADRLARLQGVTEALAGAVTLQQVGHAVLEHVTSGLRASAASLGLLSSDGKHVTILGSRGYPQDVVDRFSQIPLEAPLPLTDAIRTGSPVRFGPGENLGPRYAHLKDVLDRTGSLTSFAVPLSAKGVTFGALGLSFNEPLQFTSEDEQFLLAIARQCAQALDRARLYEAERRSRENVEQLLAARSDQGEGIVIIDGKRITEANATYCDLTGYTLEELRAFTDAFAVVAPQARAQAEERRRRRLAGEVLDPRYVTTLVRKDGTEQEVEVVVRVLSPETPDRCLVTVRAIGEARSVPVARTQPVQGVVP